MIKTHRDTPSARILRQKKLGVKELSGETKSPLKLQPVVNKQLTHSQNVRYIKYSEKNPKRTEFYERNCMSPVTLYKRQKEVLTFISQFIQLNGTSPTLQEIADALNLSSLATVHEHLKALEAKGLIQRYSGAVRGIEVTTNMMDTSLQGVSLPLVGYIAAGQPIEAIENPLETVIVSADLVSKSRRCYVLQVKGSSMINEGIFDGDYVVIQQQNTARDGDIVVALINNGFATLKKFYREKNGRIRLQPANDDMDPIYVDAKDLKIQGKVTGVVRKYV